MARLAGYGGSVKTVSGTVETEVTGMREWTLDYTADILDGRGFDSTENPHPIVGPKNWGGGFAGPKNQAPMTIGGSAVSLKLYEGTGSGQYWIGSAFVTEVHPSVSVDGLAEYSYTFIGKATLTAATG